MSGDSAFLAKLARLPSVQREVRARRGMIAAKARALFASHDRPGGHSIKTHDGAVDAYVSLVGPAAVSVEFGHFTAKGDRYVNGLHIMGRAAR